jgi:phosphatidylserine/phosphatidylglycerophosphate/cardiolipin synthase-like enzyme
VQKFLSCPTHASNIFKSKALVLEKLGSKGKILKIFIAHISHPLNFESQEFLRSTECVTAVEWKIVRWLNLINELLHRKMFLIQPPSMECVTRVHLQPVYFYQNSNKCSSRFRKINAYTCNCLVLL